MSDGPAGLAHSPSSSAVERARRWLRHSLGLDRAIGFTILARTWAALSALVTVALIAKFLSPVEQGYYYTFASLVAIQLIFELGFSTVVLQMASHERAHLSISADGVISGDPVAHARLASVLQKSVRWYTFAALLMGAALIPTGIWFFATHSHSQGAGEVAWRLPWICDVVATVLTFQIDPVFSFLEGCGFVPQVANARFRQVVIGSLLAWTGLLLHHGLYAPALMIFGQALAGGAMLFSRRHLLYPLFKLSAGLHHVRWRTEVWPFQWRIAVSWMCGYLVFQIFNPVLFAFWGPVAAGRLGMSFSICNGLNAVAISWISTKSAPFGTLVARRQFVELDRVFFESLRHAFGVILTGATVVWLAVFFLYQRHTHISTRLVDPSTFAMLLATTLLNIAVTSEAIYLRAHKQEKFLPVSILTAVFAVPSTWFFGKRFGAEGMVTGFLIITLIIGLGFGTYTFRKYRRLWHAT